MADERRPAQHATPYYYRNKVNSVECEVGFATLAELQAHIVAEAAPGDSREKAREFVDAMNAELARLGSARPPDKPRGDFF